MRKKLLILIGLSAFALSLSCDLRGLLSKHYIFTGIVEQEEMDLSKYLGSDGIDIAREVVGGDAALIESYSQKSDQTLANNLTKNYASSTNPEVLAAAQEASKADVELKKQLNLIQQNKVSVDRSGVSDSEAKDIQKNVEAITKEAMKQYSIIQMRSSVAAKLDEIVKANQQATGISKAQAAATAAANLAAQHATDAKAIATAVAGWKGFTGIPDIGTTETTIETASGDANTQKTAAETAAAAANPPNMDLAIAQKGQQDAEAAEKLASAALLSASQNKSLLDALVRLNLASAKTAASVAKAGADAALKSATTVVTATVLAQKTSYDATKAKGATDAEANLANVTKAQGDAKTADDAAQAATDLKVAWAQKVAAETAEATAKDEAFKAQMNAVIAMGVPADKPHTPELTAITAAVTAVAGKATAMKTKATAANAGVTTLVTTMKASAEYTTIKASAPALVQTFLDKTIDVAANNLTAANAATAKTMAIQAAIAEQAERDMKAAEDKAKSAKTFVEVAGLRMFADQQKQIILDAETALNAAQSSLKNTLSPKVALADYCVVAKNCDTQTFVNQTATQCFLDGNLGCQGTVYTNQVVFKYDAATAKYYITDPPNPNFTTLILTFVHSGDNYAVASDGTINIGGSPTLYAVSNKFFLQVGHIDVALTL